MKRVEYDRHKERAYVEFRGPDEDGGNAITVALFSYKTAERLKHRPSGSTILEGTTDRCLSDQRVPISNRVAA